MASVKPAIAPIEIAPVEILLRARGVGRPIIWVEANGLVVVDHGVIAIAFGRIGAPAAVIGPPEIRIDPDRGAAILEGAIPVVLDVVGFAAQLVSDRIGCIGCNDLGLLRDDAVVGRLVGAGHGGGDNGDGAKQTESPPDRTANHLAKSPRRNRAGDEISQRPAAQYVADGAASVRGRRVTPQSPAAVPAPNRSPGHRARRGASWRCPGRGGDGRCGPAP